MPLPRRSVRRPRPAQPDEQCKSAQSSSARRVPPPAVVSSLTVCASLSLVRVSAPMCLGRSLGACRWRICTGCNWRSRADGKGLRCSYTVRSRPLSAVGACCNHRAQCSPPESPCIVACLSCSGRSAAVSLRFFENTGRVHDRPDRWRPDHVTHPRQPCAPLPTAEGMKGYVHAPELLESECWWE